MEYNYLQLDQIVKAEILMRPLERIAKRSVNHKLGAANGLDIVRACARSTCRPPVCYDGVN
jgi:hypothetical protein